MEAIAGNETDSLRLVMRLAAEEAVAAAYTEITTAHLLIALSRLAEGEAAALAPAAGTSLREEFEKLGVQPKRFRRRLRGILGRGAAEAPADVMHRSTRCRAVFGLAAAMAGQGQIVPHLLTAVLFSLAAELETAGSVVECPSCRAKVPPLVFGDITRCSACGKTVNRPQKASPNDEIPEEL